MRLYAPYYYPSLYGYAVSSPANFRFAAAARDLKLTLRGQRDVECGFSGFVVVVGVG
jgi:hypothetical protein